MKIATIGAAIAASAISSAVPAQTAAKPIEILAAENFYGDVARQIGGSKVEVTSILNNPNQDPHLFEISPGVGRVVSSADIVVYSGIDYDPWMESLLRADRSQTRDVIVVAPLAGREAGDNPHAWYDTQTMLAYAAVLADQLEARDPAHATLYQQNLQAFQSSIHPIDARIDALRERLAGTPVAATEPIFGYMFDALGMKVRDLSFQLAVMNDTEPSAQDIAGFENDLRTHAVKLLIYNSQATDPTADRMKEIAATAGVPVVGATETEPAGLTYQAWMNSEVDAVAQALPGTSQ